MPPLCTSCARLLTTLCQQVHTTPTHGTSSERARLIWVRVRASSSSRAAAISSSSSRLHRQAGRGHTHQTASSQSSCGGNVTAKCSSRADGRSAFFFGTTASKGKYEHMHELQPQQQRGGNALLIPLPQQAGLRTHARTWLWQTCAPAPPHLQTTGAAGCPFHQTLQHGAAKTRAYMGG